MIMMADLSAEQQVSYVSRFRLQALKECKKRRALAMSKADTKSAGSKKREAQSLIEAQSLTGAHSIGAHSTGAHSTGAQSSSISPAILGVRSKRVNESGSITVMVYPQKIPKTYLVDNSTSDSTCPTTKPLTSPTFVHMPHYITSDINSTGYAGVTFDPKRAKPWRVKFKNRTVGRFRTKAGACQAYSEHKLPSLLF